MWRFLWIPLLLAAVGVVPSAAQSIHLPRSVPGPSCPSPNPSLYYQPVIGIVSHPGDGATGRLDNATDASNIPASYVKFVESGGARVIPLIYNEPRDILLEKLNLVNGVLFTGGWAKTGLYYETVERIFEIILGRNDAGDHTPLFAICLGFELVSMILTKDHDICERFRGTDQASTLQFLNMSDIQGSVFQRFPPELLWKMSTECLAMQNHMMDFTVTLLADSTPHFISKLPNPKLGGYIFVRISEDAYGLSPGRLQGNNALSNFFKILTTTADEVGEVYISTAQAYNYPVTAFQWHPEKNAFEWGKAMIPHTEDAIQVTQYMTNYLISEARKSSHRPPTQKVRDSLIYNYSPAYGGKAGKGYDEVYIFSSSSRRSF